MFLATFVTLGSAIYTVPHTQLVTGFPNMVHDLMMQHLPDLSG